VFAEVFFSFFYFFFLSCVWVLLAQGYFCQEPQFVQPIKIIIMDKPRNMEKVRVWRRRVPEGLPEDVSGPHQDAYYLGAPRNASKQTIEDLRELGLLGPGVQVFKYKKVENRIRPVPAVMPEDVKVRRTFPRDPLENLPVLPTVRANLHGKVTLEQGQR